MRNFNDSFMPQRFRLPEKDTRRFYEKPEWWVGFVKWGIIVVLLLGAAGFGASFAMRKWNERKVRLEREAQEARLREIEESKEREAKEAAAKAREKERAEAKAEKERVKREKREAEEQRKVDAEQKRQELESREEGPRRISDLERQQQTAGVRWWGKNTPPKFADRKEGDVYWCVFAADRDVTIVRVKVGPDKDKPAAIDIVDGDGYMRPFERELLEDAVSKRSHLVMMDRAAWIRIPDQVLEKASHVSITSRLAFHPAEVLLGEDLYRLVRNNFRSNDRLSKLNCSVEFHWRNESRAPIAWQLKFEEFLNRPTINHAVSDVLQGERNAAGKASTASTASTANRKPAARQQEKQEKPEKQHPSLASRGNSLSGGLRSGGSRSGRKLGENYGPSFGTSSGTRTEEAAATPTTPNAAPKSSDPERVTKDDILHVIEEGYLSARFAE